VAPPVERVWIEQDEGKPRPLGTPCVEDKMGQRAVGMRLAAIGEPALQALAHGFSTGHRQHPALHERREQCRTVHMAWRVEAEVRGLCDTLA
jgi:retron-type reverse transcriptase